jgi:hypothetical protein
MTEIMGWDRYFPIYERFIKGLDKPAILVEVGVFLGKGIIRAAKLAKELKKPLTIYAVDTWQGSDEPEHKDFIEKIGGPEAFYKQFCHNVTINGMSDIIFPIRAKSVDAAWLFEDNSLDMTFIDASHDYKSVREDIVAWLPKIKHGGKLAGHDIAWPDVKKAVLDELIKYDEEVNESWIYNKQ